MAEETTIAEVGLGTIAKYKLTAETSGVDIFEATNWSFTVQGNNANQEVVINKGGNNVVSKENEGYYIVFIDTSKTGTGVLKGRVRLEIEDTDYTDASGGHLRPEVSLPFDVLKVV